MKKNKARSPTNLDAIIGERIKQGRLLRGLSQEDLAERLGVTFQQLQKYEKSTNRVAASRLYAIATALELPLAYFFGDMDVVPRKLDIVFDEESADLLKRFRPLSKSNRRVVRNLIVQLAKAA